MYQMSRKSRTVWPHHHNNHLHDKPINAKFKCGSCNCSTTLTHPNPARGREPATLSI